MRTTALMGEEYWINVRDPLYFWGMGFLVFMKNRILFSS